MTLPRLTSDSRFSSQLPEQVGLQTCTTMPSFTMSLDCPVINPDLLGFWKYTLICSHNDKTA
jgi:hypothetical protein